MSTIGGFFGVKSVRAEGFLSFCGQLCAKEKNKGG